MSVPQIPPRPARSHHQQQNIAMTDHGAPQAPPRPHRRTSLPSESPNRENFPRSPFNEPPGAPLTLTKSNQSGGPYSYSKNESNLNLPQRPPSVSLPSVGQEGNEYADIEYNREEKTTEDPGSQNESPKETRNVAGDLPLYAPKPSFSDSSAKKRVSTVTRTDSSQAAAAGIGKAPTPISSYDDVDPHDRNPKAVSFRTASSASTERPGSFNERPESAQAEDEHGIPEIGQRVPMHPDAGDVQAPSQSPFQQQFPAGVGFHNSGIAKSGSRQHRRTPSGRDILPPGSYGMHGHGVQSADKFEQDWYAKHPEALQKEEHGEYGPGIGGGRGEWALSSDDLNKLVRETSSEANHMAIWTASAATGLPNEQIGYQASEQYASRHDTPPLSAVGTFKMSHSNSSQPHVESPLRKASFPVDPDAGQILQKTRSLDPSQGRNESALESETEDESSHITMPFNRTSKYTGNGYDLPTQDFGPDGGKTSALGGYVEETGYGVPILASDEVAKTPGLEFMQPAVSPAQERRGSNYYTGQDSQGEYQGGLGSGSRPGSAVNSRPSSRPGSIYSMPNLSRFSTHDDDRDNMHTPLEDVDEYEPLFPDEDGNTIRKPITPAQRMKMRENLKRFPSQDIWEDTPNSLQLQATVETPEAERQKPDPMATAGTSTFETAEQEAARKGEISESEKVKLIPREERLAMSNFQPQIQDEMRRPLPSKRFPSKDIWEDSPDSAHITATISEGPKSTPDAGLEAGAVVHTAGSPADGVLAGAQPRDNATAEIAAVNTDKLSVPPRPSKSRPSPTGGDGSADRDMAPPSIPARPLRRLHQVPPVGAQDSAMPLKQTSLPDSRKPEVPERLKPQIPARPAKPAVYESLETEPLTQVTSASSAGSGGRNERDITPPAGAPKVKPAIPARPVGGKIAGLKAGFMGDLESRLKLGPHAPKPQEKELEPEVEPKTLEDARKGRAKGPAKRRPIPTATGSDTSGSDSKLKWAIQQPWTVWLTDIGGVVELGKSKEVDHIPALDPVDAVPTSVAKKSKDLVASAPSQETTILALSESSEARGDIEQARQAVEESLHATEPLTQAKVTAPAASKVPGGFLSEESETSDIQAASEQTLPAYALPTSTNTSPSKADEERQVEQKDPIADPASALASTSHEESHTQDDSFAREKHVSEL